MSTKQTKKKTVKKKTAKMWMVVCSRGIGISAFINKERAVLSRDNMNREFDKKCCTHKVVKCTITY